MENFRPSVPNRVLEQESNASYLCINVRAEKEEMS